MPAPGTLLAISDLHVSLRSNRPLLDGVRPGSVADWLIVAGDIGEVLADIEDTLATLRSRFAKVIWVPGNHELWTVPREPGARRGVARYEQLVEMCRGLGVVTPEDEFPVWTGAGGPVRIAPLFLLYDYSFLTPGTTTVAESLAVAKETRIVCKDEDRLHPDPYATRADWCAARVAYSAARLDAAAGAEPFVLVNHWPLLRAPCDVLRYPQFAQWCGTTRTADWHTRWDVAAVVYGHLHIPRRTVYNGVPFTEVSIGYPREWRRRGLRAQLALPVLID